MDSFARLVAAGEHVRKLAVEVYTCDTCTTPKGRWSRAEVSRHGSRKGELLEALYKAADEAQVAAHQAGIDYDTAERRVRDLVWVCQEWLMWAWERRGKGAWHNRRSGESDDDYCERVAEMAVLPEAHAFEAELKARDDAFVERRGACVRMGQVVVHAREERRKIPPGKRTRPMSLKEAARLMGYTVDKHGTAVPSKKAAESLRKAMDAGAVAFEERSRMRFVFSRDDFPKESWPKILPKP
jgi:hypothetical protein